MWWRKAVVALGVVALATGGCSSAGKGEPILAERPAGEAQERADTAMWMQCARNMVSRIKDSARVRLQEDEAAARRGERGLSRDARENVMQTGFNAAYLAVETSCGMAPFYGSRMREAVRQLWREV